MYACILILLMGIGIGAVPSTSQIQPLTAAPLNEVPMGMGDNYDITLPHTISVAGNYYITAENSSISGVGLTINADDVYVDGQHYMQKQNDASDTIYCDGYDNITIVNFNQNRTTASTTQHVCGFEIDNCSNVTVRDSIFRRNGDNYVETDSVDCLVDNVTFRETYWHGVKFGGDPSGTYNFTVQNCVAYNTTYWPYCAQRCYDFTFVNCSSYYTTTGVGFIFDTHNHDFVIENCTSIEDINGISVPDAENVTITRFVSEDTTGTYGIQFDNVTHATISECNITMDGGGNCIQLSSSDSFNVTIQQCLLNSSAFGTYVPYGNNVTWKLNHFKDQANNPILQNGAGDDNMTLLHNHYSGNTSDNSLSATNLFINDTCLGLNVIKTGQGSISPSVGQHYINGGNWSQTFTASPSSWWIFDQFKINGVTAGTESPLSQAILIDSEIESIFIGLVTTNGVSNYTAINGVANTTIAKINGVEP